MICSGMFSGSVTEDEKICVLCTTDTEAFSAYMMDKTGLTLREVTLRDTHEIRAP